MKLKRIGLFPALLGLFLSVASSGCSGSSSSVPASQSDSEKTTSYVSSDSSLSLESSEPAPISSEETSVSSPLSSSEVNPESISLPSSEPSSSSVISSETEDEQAAAQREIEALAFSKITLDLRSLGYSVHYGSVVIEESRHYGLAYVDDENIEGIQFVGEEKQNLFMGFLPFEDSVSSSSLCNDFSEIDLLTEEGKIVVDENYDYYCGFVEEGIPGGHFVKEGQYVKYDVENGDNVLIRSYANAKESYDLSRGPLYDYDAHDYLYYPFEDIPSEPIEYVPLTNQIHADELKAELSDALDEQEANGFHLSSFTITTISVDALNSLNALMAQGDKINGFDFGYMAGLDLDTAKQYIHFETDGSITVKDLPPMPVFEPKSLLNYIVDVLVVVNAGAIAVVSMVFLGPVGGVIAAAVIGAGIEYFSQAVIQNKKFEDINWARVGIMALSGAIGAFIPCSGVLGYICSAVLGGLTSGALTAVDGGSWSDIAISAAQGALTALIMHGLFASCFPKGTPVLTKYGYLPIEAVEVGMLVASYNTVSDKMEWKPVIDIKEQQAHSLARISLSDGSEVVSTPNHPFYEPMLKEYLPAEELKQGNALLKANGSYAEVASVECYDAEETVYSLSIDGNHNYFVDDGYLAHNDCLRNKFNTIRKNYWKECAKNKVKSPYYELTPQNLKNMSSGKAPIGLHEHKIELHHTTSIANDIYDFFPIPSSAHHELHMRFGYGRGGQQFWLVEGYKQFIAPFLKAIGR